VCILCVYIYIYNHTHARCCVYYRYTNNVYLTSTVPPAVYALPGRRRIRAETSENVVMRLSINQIQFTNYNQIYGVRSACSRVIIACSDNPIALYIISRRTISIKNRSRSPSKSGDYCCYMVGVYNIMIR